MSVNSYSLRLASYDWRKSVPIFRYAFGTAITAGIAFANDYILSYIAPILALMLFAPGSKPLSAKMGVALVLMLITSTVLAMYISRVFLPYSMVFIPMHALALFYLYYTQKLNAVFKLFLIMSLLIIPFLSTITYAIGVVVSIGLVYNQILAILCSWLVFFIFPFQQDQHVSKKENISAKPNARVALKSLIVVLPIVVTYYSFQMTGTVLVMVFVVLLSMNPATANLKSGGLMIAANIIGGLVAIAAWQLIIIVPSLLFLMLITALVGLIFGMQVFSNKPTAPLYGSAFSTFVLVLGSVTSSDSGGASEKVWTRISQITIAVIYVVSAFAVLNTFFFTKKTTG